MNVSINAQQLLASTALVPSPSPAAILQAGTCIAEHLARGQAVETAALREAMEAFCGGSDAAGFWLWKDAYEAGEVAQVEPPRVFRRLQLLRGWSHDEANNPVFA